MNFFKEYEYENRFFWGAISLYGFNPVIYFNTAISFSPAVFGIYVGILGLEFGFEIKFKGESHEI